MRRSAAQRGMAFALRPAVDLLAEVTKDVADLIPAFLASRKAQLKALRRAVAKEELQELVREAERMYAIGNPYGFRQITTLGRFMREAAAEGPDYARLRELIADYEAYLAQVEIVFVDFPPAPRRQWTPRGPDRRKVPAEDLRLSPGRQPASREGGRAGDPAHPARG